MLFLISSHWFPPPLPPLPYFYFNKIDEKVGGVWDCLYPPLTFHSIDEWRDRSSACKIIPTACWLYDEYEEVKSDCWFCSCFTTCYYLCWWGIHVIDICQQCWWEVSGCTSHSTSWSNEVDFSLSSFRFVNKTISSLKFFAFYSAFPLPFIFFLNDLSIVVLPEKLVFLLELEIVGSIKFK